MRTLISTLLLCIFLFNTIGYVALFEVSKQKIKKEVKASLINSISTSNLKEISIKKEDQNKLLWIEKGKEFYYQGQLYDIAKKLECKDITTYYCITDDQEEELLADLEDHIKKHIASKQTNKKNNSKIPEDPTKFYQSIRFELKMIATSTITHDTEYKSNFFQINKKISSPPPQLF